MPKPQYVSATKIVVKLLLDIISKSIQWHDTGTSDLLAETASKTPIFELLQSSSSQIQVSTTLVKSVKSQSNR